MCSRRRRRGGSAVSAALLRVLVVVHDDDDVVRICGTVAEECRINFITTYWGIVNMFNQKHHSWRSG